MMINNKISILIECWKYNISNISNFNFKFQEAHVPIICLCNDRQHQKIRSLANHCFDLRFPKPRIEQITGAMMSICFREGFKIAPPAVKEIIASCNQDIRQTIHTLSMMAAKNSDGQFLKNISDFNFRLYFLQLCGSFLKLLDYVAR